MRDGGSIPGLAQWVKVVVSCGGGRRCGSDPVLLWLWCRPAAVAPIRPLCCGCSPKKKKKKIILYVNTHTHTHNLFVTHTLPVSFIFPLKLSRLCYLLQRGGSLLGKSDRSLGSRKAVVLPLRFSCLRPSVFSVFGHLFFPPGFRSFQP